MRQYAVTLTGKTPLLLHADNIEWQDRLKLYDATPEAKKVKVAGDDRSPAWRWLGSLYHDGKSITVPSDNLMRCMLEGGALVPVPGGRSGKTFKAQTQSGAAVKEPHWSILVNGKSVDVRPFLKLTKEMDFDKHQELAQKNGFVLSIKRAKIGQSKHVRVRPRFDEWVLKGTLMVWDDQLTLNVLRDIWSSAGEFKGLCDWRPSSKTPGVYGTFTAQIEELKG